MVTTHPAGRAPLKSTRQRAAIAGALENSDAFRTAQEIYDELRAAGERVGLTTVYRTLQALAATGRLDVLHNGDGEAIYRSCASDDHHHHLVCRSCGTSVEIGSEEVEDWAAQTAHRYGFTAVTHTAEVYGLCGPCSPP
ncbi:MAG: Fur family transcriptional regulator [Actinomycetota bacterium]